MRFHFTEAYARESDDEENQLKEGLAERADVIFKLLYDSPFFDQTALYSNFRNDVVSSLKEKLRAGIFF